MACEAREWLRRTNGDPAKINALLLRIKERRGQVAADQLRESMRQAYQAARRTAATG